MRYRSAFRVTYGAGVTVCVGLSLILLVSLASAYFATKAGCEGEQMAKRGVKAHECDSSSSMDVDEEIISVSVEVHEKNRKLKQKSVDGASVHGAAREGPVSKADLYKASMILSGVGDSLGYRKGRWEFNTDGPKIHRELEDLGGLENIHLTKRDWPVSDDTVMHLATAEGLVNFGNGTDKDALYKILAKKYIESMNDMDGRAPGSTTMNAIDFLKARNTHIQPFNAKGGGCGAAMRAMCIGLRYPREEDLDDLIAVSVESGRLTHHTPTGYLGALASALFTSYAIQKRERVSWGRELVNKVLPKAKEYIKSQGKYVEENMKAWDYFENKWKEYLKERRISDAEQEPFFEKNFNVKARDAFYKKYSFNGWGGASGHDAPMIAYDAFLGSKDSWSELCLRGMLHGGDSDSTGTMAGAWYGALYGLNDVPFHLYEDLEYRGRLEKLGEEICKLASKSRNTPV